MFDACLDSLTFSTLTSAWLTFSTQGVGFSNLMIELLTFSTLHFPLKLSLTRPLRNLPGSFLGEGAQPRHDLLEASVPRGYGHDGPLRLRVEPELQKVHKVAAV